MNQTTLERKTMTRFSHQKTYFNRRAKLLRVDCDALLDRHKAGLVLSIGDLLQTARKLIEVGLRGEELYTRIDGSGYVNPEAIKDEMASVLWELTTYSDLIVDAADSLGFRAPVFKTELRPRVAAAEVVRGPTASEALDDIATSLGEIEQGGQQEQVTPGDALGKAMEEGGDE